MRFSNFEARKGIASVIGGLFFLVLMTSGFTVYYIALESQAEMIDTQQLVASTEIKKIQEKYAISVASDPNENNRLQIFVKNQGYHPIEISNIWIVNKTDASEPATKYELNYADSFVPAGWGGQVLENTALYMVPDLYDIKTVSTLGTIRTAELDVVSGINNLRAELYMISPDVRLGENATVVMYVTNIGSTLVTDIIPNNDPPLSDNPTWISNSQLVSPSSIDLEPSQSDIFVWQTKLSMSGNVNSKLKFTDSVSGIESATGNTVQSNTDSDKITLRVDEGGEGEIIIKDELFGKPGTFVLFPNPLDSSSNNVAVWGVNVVNPTDQPIYVSKVVIMAVSPRATSSDKIFKDKCITPPPVAIPPTTNKWSCPESNQLMWRDVLNPQEISPKSVFPFLAIASTENVGGSVNDAMNVLIQPVVFTTLGQFGKAGYATSIHSKFVAMPNVFLAKDIDSMAPADIISELRGITAGSSVVFNATLADFDTLNGYQINAGSRLIINVPKGWSTPIILNNNGFDTLVQPFPDGSSQIIGDLTAGLNGEAKTIQFSSTAPTITTTKMYVMYILADGTASGESGPAEGFTVGPLAETVLQVCPTTGCP